jgi:hypothetical protein
MFGSARRIDAKRDAMRKIKSGINAEEVSLIVASGDPYQWVSGDWIHEEMNGEVRRNRKPFSNGQRWPGDEERGGADKYELRICTCTLEKANDEGSE